MVSQEDLEFFWYNVQWFCSLNLNFVDDWPTSNSKIAIWGKLVYFCHEKTKTMGKNKNQSVSYSDGFWRMGKTGIVLGWIHSWRVRLGGFNSQNIFGCLFINTQSWNFVLFVSENGMIPMPYWCRKKVEWYLDCLWASTSLIVVLI